MLSKEDIEGLEKIHGEVAVVRGKRNAEDEPAWEVVLKKPQRKQYKVFRAMLNNPQQKPEAPEFMFRQLVVHPPAEQIEALLERYVGIPEACQGALASLCGLETDETGKA